MSRSGCDQNGCSFSDVWSGDEKRVIFQFFIMNDYRIKTQKLEMKKRFNKMKGNNEK